MSSVTKPKFNGTGKIIMVALSLVSSLLIGAVAGGAYMGAQSATLKEHVTNSEIHETTVRKEQRVHTIVDREVMPQLATMQKQLNRIEQKVDGTYRKQKETK